MRPKNNCTKNKKIKAGTEQLNINKTLKEKEK